jgi:hypothetical protein
VSGFLRQPAFADPVGLDLNQHRLVFWPGNRNLVIQGAAFAINRNRSAAGTSDQVRSSANSKRNKEALMPIRLLLAGLVLAGMSGIAIADEYYVVQGPEHHCTVTTTKPADKTVVTQIGPIGFATREEAQGRIKQTKVCSDATTGSDTVIKKDIDKD